MDNKKILWGVLGVVAAASAFFGIREIIKTVKSRKERKSRASGKQQRVNVFTLTNNTDKPQKQFLFKSRGSTNSKVGISPSIGFFNRTLANKPKKLNALEFRLVGGSYKAAPKGVPKSVSPIPPMPPAPKPPPEGAPKVAPPPAGVGAAKAPPAAASPASGTQVEQPVNLICKDASGDLSSSAYYPMMSSQQFQKGMTGISFDNVILDGECFIEVTVLPKTKMAVVVYYENLEKSKKKKR